MTQQAKAVIGVFALVALGFALGVAADRLWLAGSPQERTQEDVRTHLLEDLRVSVGLSGEQLQSVHAVFSRYQTTADRVWAGMQPHLEAALDSALDQIEEILEPDQVEEFHRWFARTHPRPGGHAP